MKKWSILLALCVATLAAEEIPTDAMIARKAARSLLLDSVKLNNGRLVVVGERGHILYSDDQAQSWQQAVVPTRATLTTIARAGEALVVGGHDTTLLRSVDNGVSWQLISAEPDNEKPVLDVFFVDDKKGFAVGAYGYFARTVDAGATWSSVEIPAFDIPDFGFPHLYRIAKNDNNDLFLVGEAGFFARSSDNGESWKSQSFPYEGTLFSVITTRQHHILVSGMRGHLFRSEDDGKTFKSVSTELRSGLNDLIELDDGRIIVVGMDGMVLQTRTGESQVQRQQRDNRKAISSVTPLNAHQLLLTAEDGVSIYSLDTAEK